MRDDLSGHLPIGPCRSTAQSQDHMAHTKKKSTSPPHLVHLERSHLPDCTCLRSPQGLHFTQTGTLQSLIHQSTAAFNRTLLQTAQLTEAQGISQILWVKDRHTHLQAFPHIVQNVETFFHFFATRSRQQWHGTSLVDLKFSTRDTLSSIGYLSGHSGVFTGRDFLLFLTGTFVNLPASLSTPGRQSRSYGHSLAQTDTLQHLHLLKGPICGSECIAVTIADLHLLLLSRFFSFWTTHSTLPASPYSFFLQSLCPISTS